ncbi:Glycosyltransferase family 2 protein [Mycena indigotica]|uniref:Glycosyltransferase family 2 protein n=1 Tax=Mycena indigotica TaxID=2126181 RepID=A0A8H6W369_9AGAR|nr:Glycosyltransferase family 2 protein [Mycena indigotica]KAF7303914.1 Glycosyltransferase family 2 protein [Mycena indigotica]
MSLLTTFLTRTNLCFVFAAFVSVQTSRGLVRAGFKNPAHPSQHEPAFPVLAAIELTKLLITAILLRLDHGSQDLSGATIVAEATECSHTDDLPNGKTPPSSSSIYLAVLPAPVLLVLSHALLHFRQHFASESALNSADVFVIIFVALYAHFLLAKTTQSRHLTTAFLLIAAVFLSRRITKLPSYNAAAYSLVFLSVSVVAASQVIVSRLYRLFGNLPIHKLNVFLFSSSFAAYAIAALIFPHPAPPSASLSELPGDSIATMVGLLLHVLGDLLGLAILHRSSAFTLAVLALLSTSLTAPIAHLIFRPPDHFTGFQWLCTMLVVYAALSYLREESDSQSELGLPPLTTTSSRPPRRSLGLILLPIVPFLIILAISPLVPLPPHAPSYRWSHKPEKQPLMPHQYDPSYRLDSSNSTCARRPLPHSSEFVGSGPRPDFHAFDDVLLIVFFSHPRYDINLDGYRETYSQYFPNILFIGPGNREDRGFLHSEDVVVDTYGAAEDWNAGWYQIGGRMAHHMLYTAVKDNPCYAGYLWAPFDAFLNVPRLMQFPQDHIWYYTPFESIRQYVPNPATNNSLETRPPPAKVSTLTPEEYNRKTDAWGKGWDQSLWWWGEKHVGLTACMPAYEMIPAKMRNRLAELTGGPARFVGGSADTLYFPADLRWDMLDVLGTWLQTDCFLEIVVPTTLHLILPPETAMVFIDHWWDVKDATDTGTTFVRDRWAAGSEVDTFHSFHWGDVQEGGFFRPHENIVIELQRLTRDSFKRQNIIPPS